MVEAWMNDISPFVRMVKILKSSSLSGEWIDYDHVFAYIEQGEADIWLDGVKYHVTEGDAYLFCPFKPHLIRTTTTVPLIQYIFHFDLYHDDERSSWKSIGITQDKHKIIFEKEMRLDAAVPIARLSRSDRLQIKNRFLMMHRAFLEDHDGNALLLKSVCIECLFMFLKSQPNVSDLKSKLTKGWASIEKAVQFIHDHYGDRQLDNISICNHVGVSNSHLSYLFKQQLDISIHQYVTHVRIEMAKKKMMEGKGKLTDIADQTGFSSIHLFSRTFKATVGMTPSQYQAAQTHFPRNTDK